MKKIVIEAQERPKKPGKFREIGFVPGVMYGEGIEGSTSVKFNALAIKNLIAQHGSNAKIWVDYAGTKKFGLVKAVDTEPLSGNIIHLDVQMIAKDQKMKLQVPIHYIGEELLKEKDLELHISKHEVTLVGDMNKMPESIDVDVSKLESGAQITTSDLNLDKSLATDDTETVYGVVNHRRVVVAEEEVEVIKPV
ncbi:MAG: 50S ribosomal protein L25 [Firmicutes bacterium]|nr:50S ribosomal protein L25 [Bacillota bacterium]